MVARWGWAEGPAYFPAGRYLVWSDIPNDRMLRYDEVGETVGPFRAPAGYTNPVFSVSGNRGACDATAQTDTVPTVSPDAGVVYTWDGSQYHYNWSTKGLKAGEYRLYATLADGTMPYVDICLS